jgi:hypothetical protein
MAEENDFDTLLDALKGETILVQPRVSREVSVAQSGRPAD